MTFCDYLRAVQNEKKTVKMMNQKGKFRIGFIEELQAQILEMKYTMGKLSMLVLLPSCSEDNVKSLQEVQLPYHACTYSRSQRSSISIHHPGRMLSQLVETLETCGIWMRLDTHFLFVSTQWINVRNVRTRIWMPSSLRISTDGTVPSLKVACPLVSAISAFLAASVLETCHLVGVEILILTERNQ